MVSPTGMSSANCSWAEPCRARSGSKRAAWNRRGYAMASFALAGQLRCSRTLQLACKSSKAGPAPAHRVVLVSWTSR